MASVKDRYEHDIVSGHIRSALNSCGEKVIEGPAHVIHLPHLVHLRQKFSATLPDQSVPDSIKSLLTALNPTPAVCGRPTFVAKKILHTLEPFDRYVPRPRRTL